jgi:hypothetical protein
MTRPSTDTPPMGGGGHVAEHHRLGVDAEDRLLDVANVVVYLARKPEGAERA